ncbi:MAG: LexA family protein [Peptostreptococcus anaerobius]
MRLIIDPSNKNPSNGKMVAALIDGDTSTVKTLERRDNKIILKPENPDYQPMIFDTSQVSILGLVSGVFRVI